MIENLPNNTKRGWFRKLRLDKHRSIRDRTHTSQFAAAGMYCRAVDEQSKIDHKRTGRTPLGLGVLFGFLVLIAIVAVVVIFATPNARIPTSTKGTLKFCEKETRASALRPTYGTRTMDYAVFDKRLNAQQRSNYEVFELLPKVSFCFSSLLNGSSHGSGTLQVEGSSVQSREYGSAISLYLKNSGDFSQVTIGTSK